MGMSLDQFRYDFSPRSLEIVSNASLRSEVRVGRQLEGIQRTKTIRARLVRS